MTKFRAFDFSLLRARSETAVRRLKKTSVIFVAFFIGLTVASAQTFTSLLSFDVSNGAFPQGALVEGNDGNLYGTAPYGGAHGGGTVFKVSPGGKLTTLHSFDVSEGVGPYAGLIRGRRGNFYGVTAQGGLHYYGTVFEITPEGKLTTLYNFCSATNCIDGATPYAGLVEGRDGNLYGATYAGGVARSGTIFKLSPDGLLSTLHDFCSYLNCDDGTGPLYGSLLEASNGKFYGTTPMGGMHGMGTVFEITPDGNLTTLYNFCSQPNCADGANPEGSLVEGHNGKLYGTTGSGGWGVGTIYEITREGKLTTLYSFGSEPNSGAAPDDGLVQGRDGNFYGTTYSGPGTTYGYGGTVFEVTSTGKLTVLHTFCSERGCADGRSAVAGLTRAKSGIFYGTTFDGGLSTTTCRDYYTTYDLGCGTLFRLDVEHRVRTSADGNNGP
jgi:uncharacterized repeat protein (TIGR03803 family)